VKKAEKKNSTPSSPSTLNKFNSLLSVSSASSSSSIVHFLLLPSISSSRSSRFPLQPCFIAHSSSTIRFFIFKLTNRLLHAIAEPLFTYNALPSLPTLQVAGKQSCPSIIHSFL